MSTPVNHRTSAELRSDRWILRSRDLLDQQVAAMPAAKLSRLAAARRRALAAGEAKRRSTPWWLGAGLAAAASLALWFSGVANLADPGGSPELAPETPALVIEEPLDQALTLPADDVDLLASDADYALMQDLEFYAWLESAENDS